MMNRWMPALMLEEGKTYLFVSENGALAAAEGEQLQWMDVETALREHTMPAEEALWKYDGKLCNGNGKYLMVKASSFLWNAKYHFAMGEQGGKFSYANENLYAVTDFVGTRKYFCGLTAGIATAKGSDAEALRFVLYEWAEVEADEPEPAEAEAVASEAPVEQPLPEDDTDDFEDAEYADIELEIESNKKKHKEQLVATACVVGGLLALSVVAIQLRKNRQR